MPAHAGVWLQAAGGAIETTETVNGADTVDVRTVTSATLGYSFHQGFMIGAEALVFHSSLASSNTYGIGPKGGVLLKGFELTAAYLPWVRRLAGSDSFNGYGYAVNLGYAFPLFSHVRLGFLVTYWSSTFSSQDGTDLFDKPRSSVLCPQVSLGFEF